MNHAGIDQRNDQSIEQKMAMLAGIAEKRKGQMDTLLGCLNGRRKDTFGLYTQKYPFLRTSTGALIVVDYILGFVTEREVILKKYSIDNFVIQPSDGWLETVETEQTKIVTDGTKLDLALVWHSYPDNPKKYEFALIDKRFRLVADNYNVKTGFFYIKGLCCNKDAATVKTQVFFARFDPDGRLNSKLPIIYSSYEEKKNEEGRRLTSAFATCFESYYSILKGGSNFEAFKPVL